MRRLLVCVGAVAMTLSACGGVGDTPAAAPGASPTGESPGEGISFVLDEEYAVGERVEVRIRNLGPETYEYNTEYQACDLTYRDASGREFIIPPGTHCDLIIMEPIQPGETKILFQWELDECVKDEWGCVESRPLSPGTYTIQGAFRPVGGGEPARARATFRIVEPA